MMAAINHRRIDRRALRHVLEVRRRRLAEDLRLRVARIRDHGAEAVHAKEPDDDDAVDLDVTLLEIVTQTLHRIEAAIERLDCGHYGRCVRCRGRITEVRLRALPFAVRCRECETARERELFLKRSSLRSRPWGGDVGIASGHESE